MSHFPKVPVRFIEENQELLKSQDADQRLGGTDHKKTEAVAVGSMQPSYRTPPDRVNGNVLFRRNPDGSLAYDYCVQKVVDAIHRVRDGVALNSLEETALSVLFPAAFSYVAPGMSSSVRQVNLKISEAEAAMVSAKVAAHLQEELQYMLSSHAR